MGAKFVRAEVRGAYAATSRIAFKFGKIFDRCYAKLLNLLNLTYGRVNCALALALSALNSIKFNARRHRILKLLPFLHFNFWGGFCALRFCLRTLDNADIGI